MLRASLIALFLLVFASVPGTAQTRQQLNAALEANLPAIFFPVAFAKWDAFSCGDFLTVARLDARIEQLRLAATAKPGVMQRLLKREQFLCCETSDSWSPKPCNRAELEEYVAQANHWFDVLDKIIRQRNAAN